MHASRPAPEPAHEAVFGAATVYFVYTQPTAKPLDLGRSVHRLLQAEIARTAAWPSDERVRLAPSWAELDKDIRRLELLHDFAEHSDSFLSLVQNTARSPLTALELLKAARNARRESALDDGNSLVSRRNYGGAP